MSLRRDYFRRLMPFFTFIVGAMLLAFTHSDRDTVSSIDLRMVPPPPNIERFVFGYNDTAADTLWLRVIQDFGICENVANGVVHAKGVVRVGHACKKGWVYQMVDAITSLAPQWPVPYKLGALLLSVAVDDIEGATLIFEKGLARFPNDYSLAFTASYHYMWETKNPKRAGDLLLNLAKNGGPTWFYSLAGKMYSEAGQAELAKAVLEGALKEPKVGNAGRERIETRLREVNKTLHDEAMKKPSGLKN